MSIPARATLGRPSRHPRAKTNLNSRSPLSSVVMAGFEGFGMPHSANTMLIDPATSMEPPDSLASSVTVTFFVVPRRLREPVASVEKASHVSADAGISIGSERVKVAVG